MNDKSLKARACLYFFASIFFLVVWRNSWSAVFDGVGENKLKLVEQLQAEYPDVDFLVESRGRCEGNFPQYVGIAGAALYQGHSLTPMLRLHASDGFVQKIKVMQENGVYIVKWPNLKKTLLDAKIKDLHIKYNKDSNFNDLMDKLFLSNSVRRATVEMKYRYAMTIGGIINGPSHEPLNDLYLNGVTVRGALVKIVKIYHGVIFYSECPLGSGQTMYSIDYFERNFPNGAVAPAK